MPSQSLSPSIVISGGYSGYNPGGKTNGVEFGRFPHGWNSTAAVEFTPRYSFVADYGHYSNSTVGSTSTYLFGPKFTFHKGPLSPFINLAMGFQRQSPRNLPSNTAFSEAAGGGFDVAIARRFSVRLVQADFIYAADHEKTQLALNQFYGVRVSAGVLWRLGRPRRPTVAKEKSPTARPQPTVVAKNEKPAAPPAPKAEQPVAPAAAAADSSTPEVAGITASQSEAPSETAKAAAAESAPTSAPVAKKEVENEEVEKKEVDVAEKKEPTTLSVAAEKREVESSAVEAKPEVEVAKPTLESAKSAPVKPVTGASSSAKPPAAIQQFGNLRFPYDRYPTLLSPQDKRSLDAVASRMKLEPESTAVIVGAAPRRSSATAAPQRAVNSKDYLLKKGIAADRVKVFARPAEPTHAKRPLAKTELLFVPAGSTYNAATALPVDEQHVKPEHLHVAHPEWHEK